MPRRKRQFEIGGIYHIVKRGVEKRDIFLSTQDYSRFILGLEFCNSTEPTNLWPIVAKVGSDPTLSLRERIDEARGRKEKPIVELLAFTLMPNHFHLIIREITKSGIAKYMQKLGGYSTYFNKQHERAGTLFQGRYKDVWVKDNAQLDTLFVYVHTNPIELWETGWKEFKVKDSQNTIRKLEKYRWTSYNDYIGQERFSGVINKEFFLKFYGGEKKCHQSVEDWIKFKAKMGKLSIKNLE